MEKEMAPHSRTLAWKMPWTEEPGRLQSMGSRRVGHGWATSLSHIGEGNGSPLQCSCLENPRDGGAWWAAVYGVTQSRTWLKQLSSSSMVSKGGKESFTSASQAKWVSVDVDSTSPPHHQKEITCVPLYAEDSCYLTAQSCPTLCDTVDCSTPGFPVHHQLPESAQTHVHWVGDAIQPSHLLSSPSPPAFNLSQHQSLSQGVSTSHQVAKVSELQL